MGMFDDILLTVDYDRTLTGPDSVIPQRNLDAIRYFMENGGTFTLNTGRSVGTLGALVEVIPVNAPFLLYNGSAAYDHKTGELSQMQIIDLPVWETLAQVHGAFPELNLEIQGTRTHYLYDCPKSYEDFYDGIGWPRETAVPGSDIGPFMKFALFGTARDHTVGQYFSGTEEEIRLMDEAEKWINERYGHVVEVFRPAPRIIDVHAKGVSKLNCARLLQKELDKKILVCVGDAENDLTMLRGADYAFCPSDGVVADQFPNVCPCGEGAVADVIYEKIPLLLQNKP